MRRWMLSTMLLLILVVCSTSVFAEWKMGSPVMDKEANEIKNTNSYYDVSIKPETLNGMGGFVYVNVTSKDLFSQYVEVGIGIPNDKRVRVYDAWVLENITYVTNEISSHYCSNNSWIAANGSTVTDSTCNTQYVQKNHKTTHWKAVQTYPLSKGTKNWAFIKSGLAYNKNLRVRYWISGTDATKYDIVVKREVDSFEQAQISEKNLYTDPFFNASFNFRTNLTIENRNGTTRRNQPVKIMLNSSSINYSLIDHTRQDFIFTWFNDTSNLERQINFYTMEFNESGNSYFWINVTELTANSNITVFMYYNSSGANNASNFNGTLGDGITAYFPLLSNTRNVRPQTSGTKATLTLVTGENLSFIRGAGSYGWDDILSSGAGRTDGSGFPQNVNWLPGGLQHYVRMEVCRQQGSGGGEVLRGDDAAIYFFRSASDSRPELFYRTVAGDQDYTSGTGGIEGCGNGTTHLSAFYGGRDATGGANRHHHWFSYRELAKTLNTNNAAPAINPTAQLDLGHDDNGTRFIGNVSDIMFIKGVNTSWRVVTPRPRIIASAIESNVTPPQPLISQILFNNSNNNLSVFEQGVFEYNLTVIWNSTNVTNLTIDFYFNNTLLQSNITPSSISVNNSVSNISVYKINATYPLVENNLTDVTTLWNISAITNIGNGVVNASRNASSTIEHAYFLTRDGLGFTSLVFNGFVFNVSINVTTFSASGQVGLNTTLQYNLTNFSASRVNLALLSDLFESQDITASTGGNLNLTVPIIAYLNVTGNSSIGEFRQFLRNSSTTEFQTIIEAIAGNCSDASLSQNATVLNFTIRDELSNALQKVDADMIFTLTRLSSPTVNFTLNQQNNITFRNTNSFEVCIFPNGFTYEANIRTQFRNDTFTVREWHKDNFTMTNTTNFTGIKVLTGTSATEQEFVVTDGSDIAISNAIVETFKFNTGNGSLLFIDGERTDLNGETKSLLLIDNATYYVFKVYKNGKLLKTFTPKKLEQGQPLSLRAFTISSEVLPIFIQRRLINRNITNTTFNATHQTLHFAFDDPQAVGSGKQFCFNVRGLQNNSVGFTNITSRCSTNSSGEFNQLVPANTTYLIMGYLTGSPIIVIEQLWMDFTANDVLDFDVLFMAMLFFMVVVPIGIWNPVVAVVLSMVTFGIILATGLVQLGPATAAAFITFVALGIIGLIRMRT